MVLISRRISNFIKNVDLFGVKINLRYKKGYSHKTKLGGIVTIILTLVFMTAIYFFGKDVWERQQPFTNYNEEYMENP